MSAATLETRPSGLLVPAKPKEVERFPEIDPKWSPTGHRILLQIRRASDRIEGSSLLATDTEKGVQQYKCRIAKVLAIGPTAYRDRKTGEEWHGGPWVAVGDYVRIPAHGGDRWSITVDGDYANPVGLAILNDDNILAVGVDPNGDEGDAV